MGSSFLPGEIIAAFLWAQLQEADRITAACLVNWDRYHELLEPLERKGLLRRPIVPSDCQHNAHMYYVLIAPEIDRGSVIEALKRDEIYTVFHYVPLHSSPAGKRYGRVHGELAVTDSLSARLIRLPLWMGLAEGQQEKVVEVLGEALSGAG